MAHGATPSAAGAASGRSSSPRRTGDQEADLRDAEGAGYQGPLPLPHEDGPIFTSFKQELAPFAAEAVGTFIITLTFLINYREGVKAQGVISNTFMIMAMKFTFDTVSGANLNPSITISLLLSGRLRFRVGVKMIVAQILGAVCAGSVRFSISGEHTPYINIGPKVGHNWGQVAFVEILYTSLIVFVFLNTAASTRNNPRDDRNGFFGMAIGFVYMAGAFAGARVCHILLNSAIAVGVTIVDFRSTGVMRLAGWGYLMHDIIGAFLGTWLYRLVRPGEFDPVAQIDGSEPRETRSHKAASRVCAEFIGTFYVVLTKTLNRTSNSYSEPWSMMALMTSLVCSLRDVSGGYFNPAVTVSVALSRRGVLDVPTAVWDVIIQLFAGAMATGLVAGISRHVADIRLGDAPEGAVAFVEMAFTCLTCYVALATVTTMATASKTQQNNIAGLAYGACHMVSGVAAKDISGSILNPVVALAFSTLNAVDGNHESCMTYIVWELVGGVLATCIFFLTHPHLYAGRGGKDIDVDSRVPVLELAA